LTLSAQYLYTKTSSNHVLTFPVSHHAFYPSIAVPVLSVLRLSSAVLLTPRQAPSTYQLAATNNYLEVTSVKTSNNSLNTGAAARLERCGHQLPRDLDVEEEWAAKVTLAEKRFS